jgi:hypothetical protein
MQTSLKACGDKTEHRCPNAVRQRLFDLEAEHGVGDYSVKVANHRVHDAVRIADIPGPPKNVRMQGARGICHEVTEGALINRGVAYCPHCDGPLFKGKRVAVIDFRGATSVPGVFAAGDATTTPYKQIVIAMGEGARAALSAFDYLIRQPGPDSALAQAAEAA